MRAYLFYSNNLPGSKHQTTALAEELDKFQVEALNLDADSADGAQAAELYDVTTRPSVVVVRDDGSEVQRWLGKLPQASDISYYVHAS